MNESQAEQIKTLKKENLRLRQKTQGLEDELLELQNGLHIDDAPQDGRPVLAWAECSSFDPTVMHCEDGVWGRLTDDFGFSAAKPQPDRFIYLPGRKLA